MHEEEVAETDDQKIRDHKYIKKQVEGLLTANGFNGFSINVGSGCIGASMVLNDIYIEAVWNGIIFQRTVVGLMSHMWGEDFLRRTIVDLVADVCVFREASSEHTPGWRIIELMKGGRGEVAELGMAMNPEITDDIISIYIDSVEPRIIDALYNNPHIDKKQKMIIEIQTGVIRRRKIK